MSLVGRVLERGAPETVSQVPGSNQKERTSQHTSFLNVQPPLTEVTSKKGCVCEDCAGFKDHVAGGEMSSPKNLLLW